VGSRAVRAPGIVVGWLAAILVFAVAIALGRRRRSIES
jgi:hypothetical protein